MSLVPTHGAEGGADDFEGDQLDDELIELLDELLGDGAELLIEWEQGKKKRKKPGKGPRCSVNQRRRQHTGGRSQKATATVRVATHGLVSVLQGMARQRLKGTIKRLCAFRSKLGMRTGELAAFAVHARDAYAEEYRLAFMGRNRDGIGTLVCVGEYNGDPCPNATAVPLSEVGQLGVLQLDHEFEFRLIMKKWAYARQQQEERPTTWDAGINPGLLCHLLFSLAPSAEHGMEWVRPRCSQCHVNCPHERAKPSFVL